MLAKCRAEDVSGAFDLEEKKEKYRLVVGLTPPRKCLLECGVG